jgi:hypothetical protein
MPSLRVTRPRRFLADEGGPFTASPEVAQRSGDIRWDPVRTISGQVIMVVAKS